jgi:putative nucleotidyltransferase with HDIG domain
VIIVVSTSALVVTDRFMRRLLPLSLLLKMSLPFPEAPPSRIKVAIRSGSPKQLERWAAEVSAKGRKNPKALAANDLLGLVTALSVHDRRSRGHSERVRVYTDLMAEQLGLPKEDADKLRWAALLHDIGKIHVPGEILNKPGAPDDDEWQVIKRRPLYGDLLIEPVRAWLGSWGRAVIEHHERWDGKGYPRGIAGTRISLAGRVVAVTDSYEVMTATRSYKKPMSVKAARAELTRSAGSHFDPAMVRAFLDVPIGRVSWRLGPVAWLAQLPFLGQIPTWGATAMVATSVAAATPLVASVPLEQPTPVVATVDSVPDNGASSPSATAPVVVGPHGSSADASSTPSDQTQTTDTTAPKEPPGQQRQQQGSNTTTTTTSTTVPITTTTRPGNGNGRDNGNGSKAN